MALHFFYCGLSRGLRGDGQGALSRGLLAFSDGGIIRCHGELYLHGGISKGLAEVVFASAC